MRINPSHIWMHRKTALASWQWIITIFVLLTLIVAVTGFHTLPVLAGGSTCTSALNVPLESAKDGVGCQVSERTTLGIGYRFFALDYSKRDFDLDLKLHGPIVGMAFQF